MSKDSQRHSLRIAGVYAAVSAAWIAFSDHALIALARDREALEKLEEFKGLAFVAVTAALLYGLLRRRFGRQESALRAVKELGRAYRMRAAGEAAMIRARTRSELFDAICRVAVEEGGYLLAWVGLAQDDAARSVLPVARAGRDEGYVDAVRAAWSDSERGRGPTGTAIRLGELRLGRDFESSPEVAPWRGAALERGLRSAVAVPLREDGRTIGALTMYSDRADAFDPAESDLLRALGASIAYALDNLSRREKERAQVEQLRKLSRAVESSPVSIVVTDAAGRIEYVNRKFVERTGYSAAEVLGRNPRLLKSGETPDSEYAQMWTTISSGREWHGEFRNRAKDGTPFWESASISPIRDADGNITHYIAVKEDVTSRRELEQELRQAQKMEVVGTLAGGVAHDFNNILTVIQGHCTLLGAAPLPSDADRESVAEIESSAERAAALTRQLLAFGRRQPMRARRLDLNEATGRTTRMLRRLVPERIALEAVLSREPLFARADPAMLDQVLMNLVLNARDAIPGAGRVLVETAVASAALPPPHARDLGAGWAVVRVTDNGCGIEEKNLPRIFEPFFTTKPAGKGSGLGLSVVDGILRQHKGWATVASEHGRGSTFSVFLPLDPAAADEGEAEPLPAVLRGTETLLLAEDEAALRRLLARHLTALGYRVLEAPSGDGALRAWARRQGPVPLLITDMVMPGATGGEELARRLREDDPRLRVIYISGYHAALTDGTAKLEAGSAFLQKPFKPDELARLVRRVLDG